MSCRAGGSGVVRARELHQRQHLRAVQQIIHTRISSRQTHANTYYQEDLGMEQEMLHHVASGYEMAFAMQSYACWKKGRRMGTVLTALHYVFLGLVCILSRVNSENMSLLSKKTRGL
ncbi:hypothetical protein ACJQWK_09213 [Exserohilum turcicum]